MSDGEGGSPQQKSTILYTEREYYMLVRPTWESAELNDPTQVHKMLRTLVDSHLTHAMGLKNLQKREVKFSDMLVMNNDNNDTVFVLRTNYENQQVYYGCLRHQVIEFCPISAIAIYLFLRFHIGDDYGSIELYDFNETKLLKGNNKLANISYSQQHKSSLRVLELSQLDASKVNLNKLICNTDSSAKPILNDLYSFDWEVLHQRAGLGSRDPLERQSIGEIPSSILDEIFPFLKSPDNNNDSNFKEVLDFLKIVLIQDMLYIKKKYPDHPLSLHPIFNSSQFNAFAMERESFIRETFTSSLYFLEKQDMAQHTQAFPLSTSGPDLGFIKAELERLVEHQTKIKNLLTMYINNLRNSVNGLSILTSLSSGNSGIVRQSISGIIHTLDLFESNCCDSGADMINETLSKLKGQWSSTETRPIINPQVGGALVTPSTDDVSGESTKSGILLANNPLQLTTDYSRSSSRTTYDATMEDVTMEEQKVKVILRGSPSASTSANNLVTENRIAPIFLNRISKDQTKRDRALRRRLSRQATTLYEMWDDFKSLEKELKDNNISVTEWLKTHGSSERQFRHTRMKIIKFIEEEAAKKAVPVETIKEKLQTKMRNRQRPWTLDEVQRRLTAFKSIQLDD